MLLLNEYGLYIWLGTLACCTVVFVITDVRWFWLPQGLVAVTACGNGLAVYAGYVTPYWPVSLGVTAVVAILWLCYPKGIGSGDVTLLGALALGCDGWNAYALLVVAVSSAAIVGLLCWCIWRKTIFPFGPFLLLGWWCAWFWGREWFLWLGL